jgi:hypothetical protein
MSSSSGRTNKKTDLSVGSLVRILTCNGDQGEATREDMQTRRTGPRSVYLFICDVVNGSVSKSDYTASNGWISSK